MGIFASLIGAATALLKYLTVTEQNKYNAELKELREKYEIEINKPDEKFDDALVDSIEHQLCILADTITNQVGLTHS